MSRMPNAPLIYMLGMVRFPTVPDMDRFIPGLHDVLRPSYPIRGEARISGLKTEVGSEGPRFEQTETRIWQFTAPDKSFAFLLGDDFLCLHTASYHDHVDFARRLEDGLRRLLEIPAIGIEWVQSVGIRYIDLVVPRGQEKLSDYLHPWVLPHEEPSGDGSLEMMESMSATIYRSAIGNLRLQVLRNPPTTIPPELDTPLVAANGWKLARPATDFAMLDIDHGTRFDPLEKIDAKIIHERLVGLWEPASKLFRALATDFAFAVWEDRE